MQISAAAIKVRMYGTFFPTSFETVWMLDGFMDGKVLHLDLGTLPVVVTAVAR